MRLVDLDPMGLADIFNDNRDTWSSRIEPARSTDIRRGYALHFLTPTVLAVPFVLIHFEMKSAGQLLSGVAVFTALLFGVLGLAFNAGIAIAKDPAVFNDPHAAGQTIKDMRANVTYAVVNGVFLALVLITASATAAAPESPTELPALHWVWTPVCIWLFVHLGLNVLVILKRFRTAFNYLTR